MNLPANLILLFFIIVFPGIIFRRFYFYGNFSKQFRIKEPLHNLFISNIFPGILLLAFSIFFLNLLDWLSPLEHLFSNIFSFKNNDHFNKDYINNISKISALTLFLAVVIGYFSARIIRFFKLDIKYKILRYRNTWHYIFSGEIANFEKFENQLELNFTNKRKKKFYPPRVDILIEQSNNDVLYSGVLLDYELAQDDTLQLEKVYLKRPIRYKKDEKGHKKPRNIPSDIFILNTKNLLNINIYYPDIDEDVKNKKQKSRKIKVVVYSLLTLISFSIFIGYFVTLYINTGWYFYDSSTWFQKLSLLILSIQIFNLFMPEVIKVESKERYKYSFKKVRNKFIWVVIFGIIFWVTNFLWF